MSESRVTLGRVAGVFGVKGWIRVHSYTRPPENILKYRHWWLKAAVPFETRLLQTQAQNGALLAQISDAAGVPIEDRDVAAALVGAEVQVERAAMPKLKSGELYWADLLGMTVENVEGLSLGTVTDMTSNGAQDVLVVQVGEVERLIPFVHDAIIRRVDAEARLIVCDWQPDW